ncbi:MAG: hypothetical protein EPN30_00065 [Actinomycetota bacterium]|nr:MAG: hypothetical protein EPN30_00065 [Actinomycetota bacterium]
MTAENRKSQAVFAWVTCGTGRSRARRPGEVSTPGRITSMSYRLLGNPLPRGRGANLPGSQLVVLEAGGLRNPHLSLLALCALIVRYLIRNTSFAPVGGKLLGFFL